VYEKPVLKSSPFEQRRTLCLDMDDTLTLMLPDGIPPAGAKVPFGDPDTFVYSRESTSERGLVFLRPYLRTFLEAVSRMFEVVVFTAACKDYADQILDYIDPDNRFFHHRLYRDSCVAFVPDPQLPDAKVYIKDLRILGRNLADVILVDNSLQCFAYQLDGGILCNPFKGDTQDSELICILEILTSINRNPKIDVSRIFKKMYGVSQVLREYMAKGGRDGVKNDRPMSNISPSEYQTPNKREYADDTTPRSAYPFSGKIKDSRQRGVTRAENTECYHKMESSESSTKRRPSLVPSSRFRASLGGG